MEVGPTLMRRGAPERIRDLTAARQDEAPFYEAPAAPESERELLDANVDDLRTNE